MAATFDLENPKPNVGDAFRDKVANLFAQQFGRPIREFRASGKKTDIYFSNIEFGKPVRYYVEAKDYASPLRRAAINQIWADYEGILRKNAPAVLILVTRNGLSADGQAYVLEEKPEMRHQTIWEIEQDILPLTDYIRELATLEDVDGLTNYYVPARASLISYDAHDNLADTGDANLSLHRQIEIWIDSDDSSPVAILGGYGMGKTSFANMLVSGLARRALDDLNARRPILVRLGKYTRYSSLEGLLGGMFTYEYPVQNFNLRTLFSLNKQGRLIFVLDGFDEMKHAMSWPDFRHQISSLIELVSGEAKVLLLGRPSAFLSEDERFHVLRGLKRHGTEYRRLPGWPRFREYEILEFDRVERMRFVRGYLAQARKALGVPALSPEDLEKRAQEVDRLANSEPEIFNKPVHAKILVELSSDDSVDLNQFQDGISRWSLYETFFSALAERETGKEARRPIGDPERLQFQQELAVWLWASQAGATSFDVDDIPDALLDNFPDGDAVDIESKKREYLSGAALETKNSGVYFFGHRSFAEFMVARRMYEVPPRTEDHALYSKLLTESVQSFLSEAPDQSRFRIWSETLASTRGRISREYLSWLGERHYGTRNLLRELPKTSIWRYVVESTIADNAGRNKFSFLSKLMRSSDDLRFAAGYRLYWEMVNNPEGRESNISRIVSCLIHSLFMDARRNHAGLWTLPKERAARLYAAKAALQFEMDSDWIRVKGRPIANFVERTLRTNDVEIATSKVPVFRDREISMISMKEQLSDEVRRRFEDVLGKYEPWEGIRIH